MSSSTEQTTKTLLKALQGVLAQVGEPIQVLRTILDQAVAQTGADRGVFVEVTGTGELRYEVLHQFSSEDLTGEAGRFSRSLFELVIKNGEGLLLSSASQDPTLSHQKSVMVLGTSSILCMPIHSDGKVAALVHLENKKAGHFRSEHQALLRSLLEVAGPVFEALQAGRKVLGDRRRLEMSERRFRDEAEESRDFLAREWSFGRFVGRSAVVQELEENVGRAAGTDFPVLLLGETGTGKSIVARVTHHAGARSKQAFVTVFCPSLEKSMVEAELFGHRRGAFTGADRDRLGKVQAADKGTLFLDEIGELPLEIQPKLLRLLQEKTYERVGDAEERRADVRVIAATNRDLEQEVEAGRFRQDLYQRLNFIPLRIPSLRERRDDLPLLLRYSLDRQEAGRWVELSDEAMEYLVNLDYTWPGNVRTLEQLAARLTLRRSRKPVTRQDLIAALDIRPAAPRPPGERPAAGAPATEARSEAPPASSEMGLPEFLQESEKAMLRDALKKYPRLTRAELATKLKISESALYKKLKEYELSD